MVNYRKRRPLKHLNVPQTLGVGEGGKTIPQLYDYFLQIDDYIDELKNQSGAGDMTKAVYDTNDNGIVDEAENVSWENVSGKPSSFPPEPHNHDDTYAPISHSHEIGDVSGLQGELDSKADLNHNHDDTYAPISHAHATEVTQIADPATATTEDIANKINELIVALQG